MESTIFQPDVLAWATLDLHLVEAAFRVITPTSPQLDEVEDFCRELRKARSNWEFFQSIAPLPEIQEAAGWLVSLTNEVLASIEAATSKPHDERWPLVVESLERHREILRNALAQLAEAA